MPRIPRPRGFDISDERVNCYDATGQFPTLAPASPDQPPAEVVPESERPDDASDRGAEPTPVPEAPRRAIPQWRWAAALVAAVAVLAFVTSARKPVAGSAAPATHSALVPAAATPSPAVATPAAVSRPKQTARPKPRPSRRHKQHRRAARRPVPATVPAPAAVRPSAAPVRRPTPKPEPAGGEFILGAR